MKRRLAIVTLLILAGGVLLFRPWSSGTSVSTTSPIPEAEVVKVEADNTLATTQVAQAQVRPQPLNKKLPTQLTLDDVNYITLRRGNEVIVFTDGSELTVTPYIRSQLSVGIQDRMGRSYGHD